MSDDDFRTLVDDIRRHGVRQPVTVTQDGEVLDGRHRFLATQKLGVDCPAVVWDGRGDPIDLILSANVHRRHLSASQRACVAARLVAEKASVVQARGRRTAEVAAARLGVSARHVYSAAKLQRECPKIHDVVMRGRVSLDHALRSLAASEHYRRRMLDLIAQGVSPRAVVRRAMCDDPRPEIDEEISTLLPACPVRQDEMLGSALLNDGCRDPLLVWKETNILLDGHRRLRLCEDLGVPYLQRHVSLPDRRAAIAQVVHAQLGRGNLSQFDTAELELVAMDALARRSGVDPSDRGAVEACYRRHREETAESITRQRERWRSERRKQSDAPR